MTPSEQLAKRILAGGLPMLAQYVAEVTLRLDEMAEDKPEPPTALDELRAERDAIAARVQGEAIAKRLAALEEGREEVLSYLESRVASLSRGLALRDARDCAVDELLRRYQR